MSDKVGLRSLPKLPAWVGPWACEYDDGKAMGRLTHDQAYELIQYALQANKVLSDVSGWVKQVIENTTPNENDKSV